MEHTLLGVGIDFSYIPVDQKINIPINVELTADDESFQGRAYLYSASGPVDPQYVDLMNGTATIDVRVYEVGINNKLYMRWTDQRDPVNNQASSNSFNVSQSDGLILNNANLVGVVTDINGTIANATIQIFNGDPSDGGFPISEPVSTNEDGEYWVKGVLPGTLYLKVTALQHQDGIQEIKLGSQRTMSGDIELESDQLSTKSAKQVPVLLLPGIMGSTESGWAPLWTVYPRLPFVTPNWDEGRLALLDPFKRLGWSKLKSDLKKSGRAVFEVPYDWTLPITEIRDQFLIRWINRAKDLTGSMQVDIIAHSMGGLVARSYMQMQAQMFHGYGYDVRKFAMVGTPNAGSDVAYFLWEGGDPISADEVGEQPLIGKYFYSNTLSYLAAKRAANDKVCKFGAIDHYKPSWCDQEFIYDFLHQGVLSAGQLMPIYEGALISRNSQANVPIIHGENSFLKALNGIPCLNAAGCLDPYGSVYNFVTGENIFSSSLPTTAVPTPTPQPGTVTINVCDVDESKWYFSCINCQPSVVYPIGVCMVASPSLPCFSTCFQPGDTAYFYIASHNCTDPHYGVNIYYSRDNTCNLVNSYGMISVFHSYVGDVCRHACNKPNWRPSCASITQCFQPPTPPYTPPPPPQADTHLFAGTSKNTLETLPVSPSAQGNLYQDGTPLTSMPTNVNGDGTVLVSSVELSYLNKPELCSGEHAFLINCFRSQLVEFITGTSTKFLGSEDSVVSPVLVLQIDGQVQPSIESPIKAGKIKRTFTLNDANLVIENPLQTNYTVMLDSPFQRIYELSFFYFDPNRNYSQYAKVMSYYDNSRTRFILSLNNNSDMPLVLVDRAFYAPTKVSMRESHNYTELRWEDPANDTNKDVLGYEIFSQTEISPVWKYIGYADKYNYLTNDSWTNATKMSYAVRSKLASGNTTFFSNIEFLGGAAVPVPAPTVAPTVVSPSSKFSTVTIIGIITSTVAVLGIAAIVRYLIKRRARQVPEEMQIIVQ